MSGVESAANNLGRAQQGTQVAQTAETLAKKNLISNEQLDELRNGSFNEADLRIANDVAKKVMEDKTLGPLDAMKLTGAVTRMTQNVQELHRLQMESDVATAQQRK